VKRARWSRAARVSAVALAAVLVLSAGGYGIERGILADGERSATALTWRPAPTCATSTARVPVVNSVALPTRLPEGVCLRFAYYSAVAPPTLVYGNEQRDKEFGIGFLETSSFPSSAPRGTPVQLGNLTGYVDDTTGPDGTRSYTLTFEKSGWTYHVTARLDQDNKLTPDELHTVARSMAEQ